jgi:hypothetical protein
MHQLPTWEACWFARVKLIKHEEGVQVPQLQQAHAAAAALACKQSVSTVLSLRPLLVVHMLNSACICTYRVFASLSNIQGLLVNCYWLV